MAGSKINLYDQTDTNILELQLTSDQNFKGKHLVSLTNYDTTGVPAIAAGSNIEINGGFYKFASNEAISTTDPVTSATVADGTVYIMINPTTVTAYFTATAPTWSDSKQGWYGLTTWANWRYLEFVMYKSASNYVYKRRIVYDDYIERCDFNRSDIGTANIMTLTITNPIDPRSCYHGSIYGSGKTLGDIYTAVSGIIPNVNDRFVISGAVYVGASQHIVSEIYRSSTTAVTIVCMVSNVPTLLSVPSGSSTASPCAISW